MYPILDTRVEMLREWKIDRVLAVGAADIAGIVACFKS